VAEYEITALLQIVRRVCGWKKFENQSITGEDMGKSEVPCFYGPQCRVTGTIVETFSDGNTRRSSRK